MRTDHIDVDTSYQRTSLPVDDYTQLGISKIAAQARRAPREIRCPRDGAVMRVSGCTAAGPDQEPHSLPGLPRSRSSALLTIDVECPACRRGAKHVALRDESLVPAELSHTDPGENTR